MNEYSYDDLKIGMSEAFQIEITNKMMESFFSITGDCNPLHIDENYAKDKKFPAKVVYGMMTASFLSTLGGVYLPGKYCLIQSIETKFVHPVFIGDVLKIEGIIKEKNDTVRQVVIKTTIYNQDNVKVCRGTMKVGVLDEQGE